MTSSHIFSLLLQPFWCGRFTCARRSASPGPATLHCRDTTSPVQGCQPLARLLSVRPAICDADQAAGNTLTAAHSTRCAEKDGHCSDLDASARGGRRCNGPMQPGRAFQATGAAPIGNKQGGESMLPHDHTRVLHLPRAAGAPELAASAGTTGAEWPAGAPWPPQTGSSAVAAPGVT